jgi:hypothetical protein
MAISLKNKNFAVSKLASGITAAATQLTVLAGEGSKFPTTGTFRAVIWSQSYESPIQDGTREIVTMQLSAGDVFNITRAQEGTAAKAWNANDNVAHVITAGKVEELEAEINAKKTDNVSATDKVLGRQSAGAGAIEEIPCTAGARSFLALALGAANKHLIVNAAGNAPEWILPLKVGSFSRDVAGADGNVQYTGVGFKPSAIIFIGVVPSTPLASIGIEDGSAHGCILPQGTSNWTGSGAWCIQFHDGSGYEAAVLNTFDADGFTLTWSKAGTALSGTANIYYLALR